MIPKSPRSAPASFQGSPTKPRPQPVSKTDPQVKPLSPGRQSHSHSRSHSDSGPTGAGEPPGEQASLLGPEASDSEVPVPPYRPVPYRPGLSKLLVLSRLGQDEDLPDDVLHTARQRVPLSVREAVAQPAEVEVPSWASQFGFNYLAGAGVFSASFAIGSLLSALIAPHSVAAASAVYGLVAPTLHGTLGEAVGGMVRANWGAAYGSPDSAAWQTYTDALSDWIAASIGGTPAEREDACERMNAVVLATWERLGRPARMDHLAGAVPGELRDRPIDALTVAGIAGRSFLVDDAAFLWFAIAYMGAGRVAIEILDAVAAGSTAWGLQQAYTFSMANFVNHLCFGVAVGGSLTAVQQNVSRTLLPGATRPDGGVQTRRAREAKIAARQARIDALDDFRAEHLRRHIQILDALPELSEAQHTLLLALQEGDATITAAIAAHRNAIAQLERLGESGWLARDRKTVRDNLVAMASPGRRLHQGTRVAANVLSLLPYVTQMKTLAATNLAYAMGVLSQAQGGPGVSDTLARQALYGNLFAGSWLIGSWSLRMPLQFGLKLAAGATTGVARWAQGRGAPAAGGAAEADAAAGHPDRPPADIGLPPLPAIGSAVEFDAEAERSTATRLESGSDSRSAEDAAVERSERAVRGALQHLDEAVRGLGPRAAEDAGYGDMQRSLLRINDPLPPLSETE